jgi:hypothetical protein
MKRHIIPELMDGRTEEAKRVRGVKARRQKNIF